MIQTPDYRLDRENTVLIAETEVTPIHLKEAAEYVKRYHRHCGPLKFHKFSISLQIPEEAEPIGVVIASILKVKALMDGKPWRLTVYVPIHAMQMYAVKCISYWEFWLLFCWQ